MRDTPKDNKKDQQDAYSFLKETIRKPPLTRGQRINAVLHLTGFGLLLGGSFALGHYGVTKLTKGIERKNEMKHPVVSLDENEFDERKNETQDIDYVVNGIESMSYFEQVYKEAEKLAAEPMRSLVHVFSYTEEDLLDHSLHPTEDSIGLIFLDSSDNYYIFTTTAEPYRDKTAVIFADGSVVEAIPCGYDQRSGFMVVRVPQARMRDETQSYVSVTEFYPGEIEEPASVIALGNLQGHDRSILYGVVTADDLKEYGTDYVLDMFCTNIFSAVNGAGIVIDRYGDCVGWIRTPMEDDKSISAVKSSSLRTIAEILANDETIRYIGIIGSDISEIQSEALGIPAGIYVDSFEIASPAAEHGCQIGDIITEINHTEVKTMAVYEEVLQSLDIGENVILTVYRKDGRGAYKKMEIRLEITSG